MGPGMKRLGEKMGFKRSGFSVAQANPTLGISQPPRRSMNGGVTRREAV